jgi:predicted transcriptional regulator
MKELLTVIIGGDMNADYRELFTNPSKGMKQPRNILYVKSFAQMERLLSAKKLDLLQYLIKIKKSKQKKSVSTIAHELDRKQEAISFDLHKLAALHVIELTREGQSVYASTIFDGIAIQTAKT